jgi:hypothetical protein
MRRMASSLVFGSTFDLCCEVGDGAVGDLGWGGGDDGVEHGAGGLEFDDRLGDPVSFLP